ncbi:hypothetical protein IWX90DRAFT_135607 [Phyllosticta citrichinensis]|uniref:Uncharacterized protein n=1 Tax=Phyllosticta citrichinensis TaxID=1130410 RepID=A0ABR1XXX7_9PEZI
MVNVAERILECDASQVKEENDTPVLLIPKQSCSCTGFGLHLKPLDREHRYSEWRFTSVRRETALFAAGDSGFERITSLLVDHGAKIEIQGGESGNPYLVAWETQRPGIVTIFDNHLASKEDQKQKIQLIIASMKEYVEVVVRDLIHSGAGRFTHGPQQGSLELERSQLYIGLSRHVKAKYSDESFMKSLVSTSESNTKLNVLHAVCRMALLAKFTRNIVVIGAVVNRRDANGRSPLHHTMHAQLHWRTSNRGTYETRLWLIAKRLIPAKKKRQSNRIASGMQWIMFESS